MKKALRVWTGQPAERRNEMCTKKANRVQRGSRLERVGAADYGGVLSEQSDHLCPSLKVTQEQTDEPH